MSAFDGPGAELLRLAVELCPAGMLGVDPSGAIVLVNREIERMFGYSREELLGRPVEVLVPERYRRAHAGHRLGFLASPVARRMGEGRELFGLRKDGTEVPVEIGLNPLRTALGLFVLGSVVDITSRRQAEEQLRQSQKIEAIGTLAGGIAHDFNNILLGIVGHTELAMREAAPAPQIRADLEEVLRAAERGRQLVQRILTFSRRREVSRSPTELERPVREAVELLRGSLPSSIEIRRTLDPNTPGVLSDETEIHQVVMNLATNAAHAMESGGILEIALAPVVLDEERIRGLPGLRPGLHARLSVRDTGHGISPEIRERVFEPFFTTKPPGVGTGLGLSVIHGIVTEMGGAIELHSRQGEGTRVDVFLPALEVESAQVVEGRAARAADTTPHVLLVDDDESIAILTRRQIVALGYRVTAHTSSLAALADFRARPLAFQLLVTDNTMPGMTGVALAEEIHRARPELPILLISGLAETADAEAMKAKGIGRLLPKPHSSRQLREVLEDLLGR